MINPNANGGMQGAFKPELKLTTENNSEQNFKSIDETSLLKPLTLKGHTNRVWCVAQSLDGSRVLSGSSDKTLRLWDMKSSSCIREIKGHKDIVTCVALSPDGTKALSGSNDKSLRLWDTKSGSCIREIMHTGRVTCVALSPNENQALSGGLDSILRLWDLNSGNCIRELKGHTGNVECVVLTTDGKQALSGSADETLRLWDLENGNCIQEFKGHTGVITCVALSPDRSQALSGSWDKTLRLWDVKSGTCLRELKGHTDRVWCVALSPDGSKALSGSDDNTLRLWDLKTGEYAMVLNYETTIWSIITCIHQSNLYALTGLSNGAIDFRPICAMTAPVSKSKEKSKAKHVATSKAQEQKTALETSKTSKQGKQLDLQSQHKLKPSEQLKKPEQTAVVFSIATENKQIKENQSKLSTKKDTEEESRRKKNPTIELRPMASQDIKVLKELGKGAYSTVYMAKWCDKEVAVKELTTNQSADEKENAKEKFEKLFIDEFQLMAQLRCPNVIQFYGYFAKPQYSIVMEYMPGGSLFGLLHSTEKLEWDVRIHIATEIACGINYLHKENVVHRDLKSQNVLLNRKKDLDEVDIEDIKVKITDFGMSKIRGESSIQSRITGTMQWLAPEVVKTNCFNKASDIYSMGITFWEIASREIPFKNAVQPSLIPLQVGEGVLKEKIDKNWPKKLGTIIEACWNIDPLKRPSADIVAGYLKSKEENFDQFLPLYRKQQQLNNPGSSTLHTSNKNSKQNGIQKNGLQNGKPTEKVKSISSSPSSGDNGDYLESISSNSV